MKSLKLTFLFLICVTVIFALLACNPDTPATPDPTTTVAADEDTSAEVSSETSVVESTEEPTEESAEITTEKSTEEPAEPEPDVSDVIFADKTVTYNGSTQNLAVENLPEGVTVVYGGNEGKNAGTYTATATLYYGNKQLRVLNATLTVTPRHAAVTLAGGSFLQNTSANMVYTVDGLLDGDDLGISITMDTSVIGAHQATATWSNTNYDVTVTGGSYTVSSTLFDSSHMSNYSASFIPGYGPFCLYNTSYFSGQVITSISFPYGGLTTGYTTSSQGLYLPIYVIKSDLSSTQADCTIENGKKILIDLTGKLNGVQIGDWITVDVNITVDTDETLAFGDPSMVVLPLFLRDNGTYGFWNRAFTDKGTNNHSLIFTICGYPLENNGEDNPVEGDKLNISFMGDSISTYTGWSNHTSFNSTIGGNAVWYPNNNYTGANMTVESTWWYQTMAEGGYDLCVNNSWSGSRVMEAQSHNVRAKNLHNTTTEEMPDVIVILMGVNDWNAGTAVGTFDGTTTPSANPTTFSEAYGRMIAVMKEAYPDAEIYCCTFLPDRKRSTNGVNGAGISETVYNDAIRTIAANMGVGLIDLYADSGITGSNVADYTTDRLHPNAAGMDLMTEAVLSVIGRGDE